MILSSSSSHLFFTLPSPKFMRKTHSFVKVVLFLHLAKKKTSDFGLTLERYPEIKGSQIRQTLIWRRFTNFLIKVLYNEPLEIFGFRCKTDIENKNKIRMKWEETVYSIFYKFRPNFFPFPIYSIKSFPAPSTPSVLYTFFLGHISSYIFFFKFLP